METFKKDHQDGISSLSVEKVSFKISEEAKELVKSAELLSKKGKKRHITSVCREKGE